MSSWNLGRRFLGIAASESDRVEASVSFFATIRYYSQRDDRSGRETFRAGI